MNKVAIIAASQTRFGDLVDMGIKEMFAESFNSMINSVDNGIDRKNIEAAYIGTLGVGGYQLGQPAPLMMSYVGLPNIPSIRVENACASGGAALYSAFTDVISGRHEVVLAAGVEKMRDLSGMMTKYWLGVSGDTEYERLAGTTFAGIYALMADRYMYERKIPKEILSKISVKNHLYGSMNPKAQLQKKITLEQAMSAPNVASPLNIFDCSLITDGAATLILTTEKRAREFTDTPIIIEGIGTGSDYLAIHERESITRLDATRRAAADAFKTSGMDAKKIDVAEVHDCFTIAELMAYEDLGLVDKGEGYKMAERLYNGESDIAVNRSGGLKSKGHPLGATGISQAGEIFNQLRGTVDKPGRQVHDAETGLTHNVGGSGGFSVVGIYRRG